jgi:hypothetical protein
MLRKPRIARRVGLALARGIPLITADRDFFNAFVSMGGQGRLLR